MCRSQKGVEKQYRWNCPGCDIALCYQPVPFADSPKYLFAMDGAFTARKLGDQQVSAKLGLPTGGLDEGLIPGIDPMTGLKVGVKK